VRLVIVHADAPSLNIVTNHIAKVAKAMGHDVETLTEFDYTSIMALRPDGIIWFLPVNPPSGQRYAGYYSLIKMTMRNVRQIWYGTTEGTPYGIPATYPIWYEIDFVANSMYVAKKLREVGYRVIDVIYHGYDPDENAETIEYAEHLRNEILRKFPNKVIFSIAEGGHVRKGWEKLIEALNQIPDAVREKFVILAIAPRRIIENVIPNAPQGVIHVMGEFGQLSRKEVLALFYISDYVLIPSMAEGFGLPALEANSLGRLVIFTNMEPLNEFIDTNANIAFPYDEIREVVIDNVEFELHDYNPQYLADAIIEAIDLARSGEYEDRAKRAYEKVKDMTIMNLYTKLIRYIV